MNTIKRIKILNFIFGGLFVITIIGIISLMVWNTVYSSKNEIPIGTNNEYIRENLEKNKPLGDNLIFNRMTLYENSLTRVSNESNGNQIVERYSMEELEEILDSEVYDKIVKANFSQRVMTLGTISLICSMFLFFICFLTTDSLISDY